MHTQLGMTAQNGRLQSQAGLGDYQVRGWKPWHHHMALVMMAMLFMLKERIEQQEEYPLLSCADIEALLAHFLPRRDVAQMQGQRYWVERSF